MIFLSDKNRNINPDNTHGQSISNAYAKGVMVMVHVQVHLERELINQ
jgi:hypothetical protein